MEREKLINMWRKRCVKGGNTPIALVCVDKDGFPVIFTHHDSETLSMVWKHLANAPLLGGSTHLENQEN